MLTLLTDPHFGPTTRDQIMGCPFDQSDPTPLRRRTNPTQREKTDLRDPDLYLGEQWGDLFDSMRREKPVFWNDGAPGEAGFWAVMAYDEAEIVLKDAKTYSADFRNGGYRIFDPSEITTLPRPEILSTDSQSHDQFRKALQPAFSADTTERMTLNFKRRARELVSAIAGRGHADFTTDLAMPLSMGLLTDLFELPETDTPLLVAWSSIFVGDDEPDYQLPADERAEAMKAFDHYVDKLAKERIGSGREDFFTLLTEVQFDGAPLDFEALCVNFATLCVAINETTRHVLSSSLLALTEFPEERRKLVENPDLIEIASKELLRWITPLRHIRRTAMRDAELAGEKIRKGDKVVVWYGSVNRDETIWADANVLRVDRFSDKAAKRHMTFGTGKHYCMGWRYSELEITILFAELFARIPDIRPAPGVEFLRSNFIRGIKKLPVVFTPAPQFS